MKLELAVKQSSGRERGGVDFHLVVKFSSKTGTDQTTDLDAVFEEEWNRLGSFDSDSCEGGCWVEGDLLWVAGDGDYYEKESFSKEKVRGLVQKTLETGAWKLDLQIDLFFLKKKHYLFGNAE